MDTIEEARRAVLQAYRDQRDWYEIAARGGGPGVDSAALDASYAYREALDRLAELVRKCRDDHD